MAYQNTFFGADIQPVKDRLERVYTPQVAADALAGVIAELLDRQGIPDAERTLVEPSAGGGAFLRSPLFRMAGHTIGVDMDPEAVGLSLADTSIVMDWMEAAGQMFGTSRKIDAVVGNPPFSPSIDHWRAACDVTDGPVGFIIPISYMGVQQWAPVMWTRTRYQPTLSIPIIGRLWPQVRECVFYVREHAGKRGPMVSPFGVTKQGERMPDVSVQG